MEKAPQQNSVTPPARGRRRGRALLLSGIALGALLGMAMVWLNSYLQSDSFRHLIGHKTAVLLRAEGDFMPFHWSGWTIYSDGLAARGRREAVFAELRADQIHADLNLRGLLHRSWQIDHLDLQRLQVTLGPPLTEPADRDESTATWPLPNHVELREVTVQEAGLTWGQNQQLGTVEKVRVTAHPDDEAWTLSGTGGQFRQSGWPALELDSLKLRYQYPRLFVTEAKGKLLNEGKVHASGEIGFGEKPQLDLLLQLHDLSVTPLLATDWRAKLKGTLGGDVKINGVINQPDSFTVKGSLALGSGQVEALPVLDKISLFTHTQQFRTLILQKASSDFVWTPAHLTITNFVAESAGLLRVEGQCIITGDQIDGKFQVGVTPNSLRLLPGARQEVFTVARDGYLWTPMRVTGSVKNPQEDLTPRLLVAAGNAVVGTVEDTLEKTTNGLLDLVTPLLQ